MESQGILNSLNNLEKKKRKLDVSHFLILKLTTKLYGNQNSMVLAQSQTYRPMVQSREPRNKPLCIYSQMIFDKGARIIQWNKESLFNKCCWESLIPVSKRNEVGHYLTPCTIINLKWIKDLSDLKQLNSQKKTQDKSLMALDLAVSSQICYQRDR